MPVGFKSRVKSDAVRITLREARVEEKDLLLAVLAEVCVWCCVLVQVACACTALKRCAGSYSLSVP